MELSCTFGGRGWRMNLDGWRTWGRDDSTCRAADARLSRTGGSYSSVPHLPPPTLGVSDKSFVTNSDNRVVKKSENILMLGVTTDELR
jgi:hypothetical protein